MDSNGKWYVMEECQRDDKLSTSSSSKSIRTVQSVGYESDLLSKDATERSDMWYAVPEFDGFSSLSKGTDFSSLNLSSADSVAHSLSSGLAPIAACEMTSSQASNPLSESQGLETLYPPQYDLEITNKEESFNYARTRNHKMNRDGSTGVHRPDPVGQSLPDLGHLHTGHAALASVATAPSHLTPILDSHLPEFVGAGEGDVASPVSKLLGSEYVAGKKLLEQLRQEQLPSLRLAQERLEFSDLSAGKRRDTIDSKGIVDTNQEEHSQKASDEYTLQSETPNNTNSPSMEFGRLVDNQSEDDLALSSGSYVSLARVGSLRNVNIAHGGFRQDVYPGSQEDDSPDLGIASAVTDFSSPRGGRSMHSGISTQSSDSARGCQPLVDHAENVLLEAAGLQDHHLSMSSLSSSDSFSSELIRLQETDESNSASVSRTRSLVEASNNVSLDLPAAESSEKKQRSSTTDKLIEQMHRSLGAGTVTPLTSVYVSSAQPTALQSSDDTKYSTSSRMTPPQLIAAAHLSLTSDSTGASMQLKTSDDEGPSWKLPRSSPVLPARHATGIYDIKHSSGPGSTNRRRQHHGKEPIMTRTRSESQQHGVYVSMGSEESYQSMEKLSGSFSVQHVDKQVVRTDSNMPNLNELPLPSYPQPLTSSHYESDETNLTDDTDVLLNYPSMIADKIAELRKLQEDFNRPTPSMHPSKNSNNDPVKYHKNDISSVREKEDRRLVEDSNQQVVKNSQFSAHMKDVNKLWERFLSISQKEGKIAKLANIISQRYSIHDVSSNSSRDRSVLDSDMNTGSKTVQETSKTKDSQNLGCDYCGKKDAFTNCPTPSAELDSGPTGVVEKPLTLHAWTQTTQEQSKEGHCSTPLRSLSEKQSMHDSAEVYNSLSNYRVPLNITRSHGATSYKQISDGMTRNQMNSSPHYRQSRASMSRHYGRNSIGKENRSYHRHNFDAKALSTDETNSDEPRLTLQEALLVSRPDFIRRSMQRQLKIEENKTRQQGDAKTEPPMLSSTKGGHRLPQRVTCQSTAWDHLHKPTKRFINRKDMISANKRKYSSLPEVVTKQQQQVKAAQCRSNRLKVKAFDQKLRTRRLGKDFR